MHKHTLEPSDLYGAYRHALDETESALADWWSAAVARRREAYAIYRAAAEREHAAAVAWLKACRVFDKAPAPTARAARA